MSGGSTLEADYPSKWLMCHDRGLPWVTESEYTEAEIKSEPWRAKAIRRVPADFTFQGEAEEIAAELRAVADRLERENVFSAQGITRDWLRSLADRVRLLGIGA